MKKPRQPTPPDLANLAAALDKAGVEYVVIGGAAMALNGFPRMTKDIDLLLPVDPENNKRLLAALRSVPNSPGAVTALRPEFLDQGYSTSFCGEIEVDLLYVAADRVFGELRDHIRTVNLDGTSVSTLDVEGLLATKQTTREEDIPDRLKLERLRNALYDQQRERRIDALKHPGNHATAADRLYAAMAIGAMASNDNPPNWKALEAAFIEAAMADPSISAQEAVQALCRHSPGAVYRSRQDEIETEVRRAAKARARARARRAKVDGVSRGNPCPLSRA